MDDLNLDKLMRKGLHREYPVDEHLRAEMWKAMPITTLPFWKRWKFYVWSLLALLLIFLTYQLIPNTSNELAKTEEVAASGQNGSSISTMSESDMRNQKERQGNTDESLMDVSTESMDSKNFIPETQENKVEASDRNAETKTDKRKDPNSSEQRRTTETFEKDVAIGSNKSMKHKISAEANKNPEFQDHDNSSNEEANSTAVEGSDGVEDKKVFINEEGFGFKLPFKSLSLNLWWEELPFAIDALNVKHLTREIPQTKYPSQNKWSFGVNGRTTAKSGETYVNEMSDSGYNLDPIELGPSFYSGSEVEIRRYLGDFYIGTGLGLTKSKQKLGITNTSSDSLFEIESKFILLAENVPYENRVISYVKEYSEEVYVGDSSTQSKLESDLVFSYFHIPVTIGYDKSFGRWGMNTSIGANIMIFKSSNLNDFSETRLSQQINLDYKTQNQTNTYVSLGATYALTNKLSLGVDYRFDQLWKEKNEGLKTSWTRHGAQIGLRYSFFGP